MARSVRLRLWAGLAAGAVIAAVPVAATAASASTGPGSNTLVPVSPGISATSVPGAIGFGNTPASTPETVSFIFKERNLGQLEAAVTRGVKNYLSVGQFAREYGANPALIAGLESYLGKFGIKTSVYAGDVDVVANGTAGEFDQALAVTQHQYKAPAQRGRDGLAGVRAQTFHGTAQKPEVPASIADSLVAILGLTDYSPFDSQAQHADTSALKKNADSTNSCLALTGLPDACNVPSDFASNYGLNKLYDKADGSGQTLAIVTLAALDPTAPAYYWQNIAHIPATGRTLTVDNVDGGPGAPSDAAGSGETDLDVEQSGSLAPGADVIVYQAPNTDSGFADAFFDAASQNIASTVSASWLESETYLEAYITGDQESPGYQAAFDEAFLEMGAQGQSSFVASGDQGAYMASDDLGTTNISVGTSADSPYITAAGGTTLPWSATLENASGVTANVDVPNQRTWGWDYLWQPVATLDGESYATAAESNIGGGGGGYSTIEQRPSYQNAVPGIGQYHAVQYLTPTDYTTVTSVTGTNLVEPTDWSVNPTPKVSSGYSNGRAEPDLSADADPYTGYLLYEPSAVAIGDPALQGGWGGTSFVAPQLNGSTAVIDSYLGHRVGLWNPSIYAFATSRNSPLTPLNAVGTSSDNLYYTGNPGSVYNVGSGLGFPNLSKLAADFASES
jgi:kumamolisin